MCPMLPITDTISIDPAELEEVFVRASGPGGQNVNKVSSPPCSCARHGRQPVPARGTCASAYAGWPGTGSRPAA